MRRQGAVLISISLVLSRQCHGLVPGQTLWTVDHSTSITCRYLPGCYTGTKLHCLVTEAHGCEQLAQGCYLQAEQPRIEPESREYNALTITPAADHAGKSLL